MGLDQYRVTRITQDGKNSTVGLYFDGRERFPAQRLESLASSLVHAASATPSKAPKERRSMNGSSRPMEGPDQHPQGTGTETGRVINEVLVYERQPGGENTMGSKARDVAVEALDEALTALSKIDQRKSRAAVRYA